jgi:predicted dinucleotide-binding enzyme
MRIGIIGAGNIGGTLARRLAALGHDVSIANSRGPETLAALARESGAKPVTVQEAARAGDVVIVTIPEKSVPRLPAGLFDGVPGDVVVVDTGNYYPQRDGRIDAIEQDTTESRWVSQQLVEELGFDGLDAGNLDESWRQQPGTPVYCTDLDAEGVRLGLGEAKKQRPAGFRTTATAGR